VPGIREAEHQVKKRIGIDTGFKLAEIDNFFVTAGDDKYTGNYQPSESPQSGYFDNVARSLRFHHFHFTPKEEDFEIVIKVYRKSARSAIFSA